MLRLVIVFRSLGMFVFVLMGSTCLVGDDSRSPSQTSIADTELDESNFFENQVRPLLVDHCIKCHGREKQEGGLRLDTEASMLAGGESGAVIEPGDPDSSRMIAAIRYEDLEMPPSGKLAESEVAVLEEWVRRGAIWPSLSSETMELRTALGINDADRDYWAFRPLRAVPPAVTDLGIARTPVDGFVLAALQQHGLTLAPEADRSSLVRRLYFDLIGVPPSVEELQAFFNDEHADAYENLVDRLLSDPRYGEKWASHWLDLVRYAESDGFKADGDRPTAYLYRDWVIRSLNSDMPYDEFVLAQLAGDEIDSSNPDLLTATGYLRHWSYEYNQRDVQSQWNNILNDITDVTGEVFFGLGVGCARCHDHKFDPILQKDYFRLQASFAAFIPRDRDVLGTSTEIAEYHRRQSKWDVATKAIRQELDQIESALKKSAAEAAYNKFPLNIRPILFSPADKRNGYEQQIAELADRQAEEEWKKIEYSKRLKGTELERWEELRAQLESFDGLKPPPLTTIFSAGEVDSVPPQVFIPAASETDPITPARFEVFGADELLGSNEFWEQQDRPSGRRTALAQWINSPENPLPHRVIVNRMWQQIFGTGIVKNSSDFGRLGTPPTHPELLDWLAVWFLDHNRSFKSLHRLLVTSAVYRQSSSVDALAMESGNQADYRNELLWRFPVRRLEAEQIRDAMLVVSQSLDAAHHGPSAAHESMVRSVYTKVKRNDLHPLLAAFDAPDRSSSIGRRNSTTTPNQALLMVNSEWPVNLAKTLSRQIQSQSDSVDLHVQQLYRNALQRSPSESELATAVTFLKETTEHLIGQASSHDSANEVYQTALADLCHVIMNSSEFLYLE
jgi:Protein of unknown function (DUF1553)/Protein of unknown function (DUF1549)/Planctomycete cytochrome C